MRTDHALQPDVGGIVLDAQSVIGLNASCTNRICRIADSGIIHPGNPV